MQAKLEDAKSLFTELLKEHPMYASFIFVSLEEFKHPDKSEIYFQGLEELKKFFLDMEESDLGESASVVLSQIRLLKSSSQIEKAYGKLSGWIEKHDRHSDVLDIEHVKLLIEVGKTDEALKETQTLLGSLHNSLTRHYCSQCGFNSDEIFWRCPQCHKWETIQFRWKV